MGARSVGLALLTQGSQLKGMLRAFALLPALVLLPACLIARSAEAQPAAPPPAPAAKPDPKRVELDNLLAALKVAPNEQAAAALEARISQAWMMAGSPVAVLLVTKGDRNLRANADQDALGDFDAALTLAPDYAEAYHRRAVARFSLNDYPGALADIQQTLSREPKHFAAWQTLSRIAEARQDWNGALAAWQQALAIDPKMPDGQKHLDELRKKVLGEET